MNKLLRKFKNNNVRSKIAFSGEESEGKCNSSVF